MISSLYLSYYDSWSVFYSILLKAVLYWYILSCDNAALGHYCQVPDTSQNDGKAVTNEEWGESVTLPYSEITSTLSVGDELFMIQDVSY